RRKQKWSVDPRNSTWSKDESKFGQKMLERMGWSKGKGLGKSEQGATEHIKVKVKNNNMGLGTTVYNEDNWIAHQEDFNQLLAELNNCHRQNPEEPTQEEMQGFSLEKKSKTSKKRVHYMKFTKGETMAVETTHYCCAIMTTPLLGWAGKDLSNRSETDLACIFGKRLKQTSNQDEVDHLNTDYFIVINEEAQSGFQVCLKWDFIDRIENQSEQNHNGIPGDCVARAIWRNVSVSGGYSGFQPHLVAWGRPAPCRKTWAVDLGLLKVPPSPSSVLGPSTSSVGSHVPTPMSGQHLGGLASRKEPVAHAAGALI
ncbi:hypothetical protein P4O66_009026, partial [Electrophorus voltai]